MVHGWHCDAGVLIDLAVHADAVLAHLARSIQTCEAVARKYHGTARRRTLRLEKRSGELRKRDAQLSCMSETQTFISSFHRI